ncbi:MAG: hypothetical protein JNK65_08345, partial [Deltaproteobacteria bacterium]|nr:hypothetical protein [Deltaproteobacteria bacterium]
PTRGRLDSQELLFVGLGRKNHIVESEIPSILNFLVEKLMLKKSNSFVLSFSDFVPGMFEWRNTVRLFMSMISGRKEDLSVTLVEKTDFVEDARKRHMDFAFDVQVHYELVGE